MKTWAGLLVIALVGCADEGTPSETAATMSGTSPTTTSTTGEDETGDSNDDDDPPNTSGDDDPGSSSGEPDPDSGPMSEDSSSGDPTSGSGLPSVRGAVIRSVEPAAGNDGIGDLYVGLLAECSQDAAQVGSAMVMNADLSAAGSNVMYEILDVPDGTFFVVAFMDDNGNAADGMPDMGDLVTADGLGPGCVEVTVAGADVVAPEAVNLNFLYPF
jgi:hypothetical protein